LEKFSKKKGLEFHAISAAAGEGVQELVRGMADALDRIPKEELEEETQAANEMQASEESSSKERTASPPSGHAEGGPHKGALSKE
jgi:hypothetical protein